MAYLPITIPHHGGKQLSETARDCKAFELI